MHCYYLNTKSRSIEPKNFREKVKLSFKGAFDVFCFYEAMLFSYKNMKKIKGY